MVDATTLAGVAIIISVFSVLVAIVETYMTKRTVDLQRDEVTIHKQEVEDTKERFVANQERTKAEERARNIRDHTDRLIHRLDLVANPTKRSSSESYYPVVHHSFVGWARGALRSSEDRREWMEHLLTGHEGLYNLLVNNESTQKESFDEMNGIMVQAKKEVDGIADRLGLAKTFPKEFPSCDRLNASALVVNRLKGGRSTEFVVVSPAGGMAIADSIHNVSIDNTTVAYCGQDKQMADGFAKALNQVGEEGSNLRSALLAYSTNAGKVQSNDSAIDGEFDSFIRGKELESGGLGGACEFCLRWQDEETREGLRGSFLKVRQYLAEEQSTP